MKQLYSYSMAKQTLEDKAESNVNFSILEIERKLCAVAQQTKLIIEKSKLNNRDETTGITVVVSTSSQKTIGLTKRGKFTASADN